VRVQLRRRQIGVAEHLLHAAEVRSAFEQVGRKRVAEQVGVHSGGIEAGLRGASAKDEESSRTRERPALRVEEELRPVTAVEVRAAAREVAPHRLRSLAADRHHSLLVTLAYASHETVFERDAALLEPDGFGDPQSGAVQKLDEREVAQVTRLRAGRGLDQGFCFAGGVCPR
jgi:hypothetical protein